MPPTRFLFWNINRKPLARLISDLARIHDVDLVILAECTVSPAEMILALNATRPRFGLSLGVCKQITIFTAFGEEFLRPVSESDRVSIRSLQLPARDRVLLAAAHLPSKLHWSDQSQSFECTELARMVDAEERKAGHRRTILVGDFNMNPFEVGMVGSVGLHAVASRQVASGGARTVQGREYQFFYNPMWCHLGDALSDTAGSYFYQSSEHVSYFWNVFDQVLLRPDLAARFDPSRISIVKQVGGHSLVRPDGRPDRTVGSDHLPLLFEVEF